MNKFLKDLEKELKKLKFDEEDIKEILEDHKEMIDAAKREGLDEKEVEKKFGNPEKLAKEIHSDGTELNNNEDYNFNNIDSCVEVDTAEFNLVKTFPVLSKSMSIDISLVGDDLTFAKHDGESILIYEKGLKNIDEYTISFNNDILQVRKNKKMIKVFSFTIKNAEFVILIPKNIKFNNFDYYTISGSTTIDSVISNNCAIKSTSGDVEITNINSKKVKISTISGDFEISGVKTESFELSLISGDLEMKKALIQGDFDINTVSGDIDLKNVECHTANFKTVSGDLEGKEFYPKEIALKSVSGDVIISNNNKNREIHILKEKSVSGEIVIK